jgi:hypothetical protein
MVVIHAGGVPVRCAGDFAAYGCFGGEPSRADVERFFYVDADRNLIARCQADHHRLGFAVQLGTVRAAGRFLEDPLDVPWAAVEFLAEQLEIGDASCVKKYVRRPQTPYEHVWEIRDRYGYRSFDDPGGVEAFARFLGGRARTHAEGPVALFDHAVALLGLAALGDHAHDRGVRAPQRPRRPAQGTTRRLGRRVNPRGR